MCIILCQDGRQTNVKAVFQREIIGLFGNYLVKVKPVRITIFSNTLRGKRIHVLYYMLKHEHAVENVFSHLNGVDFDYYLLYEDDSLGIQDRTDTTSGSIKG